MKKVFILFLSCLLLLFSICPAFAALYYSPLPEPQPFFNDSDFGYNTVYFVAERSDGALWLYQIQYLTGTNLALSRSSTGIISIVYTNTSSSSSASLHIVRYSAKSGGYNYSWHYDVASLTSRTVSLENYVSLNYYGINALISSSSSSVPLTQISWSDSTDPQTYVNWLEDIYTRQGNIQIDLELFYSAFNTFRQVNHSDLTQIYDLLSDIYSLLSSDSTLTTAPVDDFSDSVQDYNSVEDQLMVDYQADVDLQFQNSNQVFTGNNAFSLISTTFTDLFVNGNLKLNALILFSLALGLGVLILGRKLNA